MSRRPAAIRRARRGFTLVEAICAISVIATLGSVASSLIYTGTTAYRDAATHAQLHEEASTALDLIVREIRKIPQDDAAATQPAPAISAVAPSSIAFGTSSFALSSGQLRWIENGASAITLLDGVSAFTIQCYDAGNAALATSLAGDECNAIRRVQVSITLTRQGISETIRTKVFIRSMMQGAVP